MGTVRFTEIEADGVAGVAGWYSQTACFCSCVVVVDGNTLPTCPESL